MPQHLPSRVLAHRLPHQTLPAASGLSVSVRFSYWQTRKLTSRGQVTKLARSYGRSSQSQIPDSILGRPLCSFALTTSRIMISRFPRRSLVPLTHARAKQVLYQFNRPCRVFTPGQLLCGTAPMPTWFCYVPHKLWLLSLHLFLALWDKLSLTLEAGGLAIWLRLWPCNCQESHS